MRLDYPVPESFPILEDYLSYMETIQGRAAGTVKEYRYDLLFFFRFLRQHRGLVPKGMEISEVEIGMINETFIQSITLSDCYAFLAYLTRERKASAANRSRKVSSLRSFFKYLKTKANIIEADPTIELETPRQAKRLPRYLTLQESKALLAAADQKDNQFSERDYCILTLFLNCGLRLSELCSINLADISEDTLRVTGKGNKERTVYLNAACIHALEDYLAVRPKKNLKDKNALFISRQGNRIATSTVQRMIKKYLLQAGLDPKRYSTHKLRHTAATLMHKYGKVDIRLLQQILGHESISTTEIYTHVDSDSLHDAVDKNPLAGERAADEESS